MAFKTAERQIVSRIQRSRAQLEVDQAVQLAFETGETLADMVPASQAEELERMIRNGTKLYGWATIVEIRPTDYETEASEVTDEDGTVRTIPSESLVEVAFIVKKKRKRRKPGENGSTVNTEDDDSIEEDETEEGDGNG